MIVERLSLGVLATNCFMVGVDEGPLVVIDPAGDAPALLEAIGERQVAAVVLTHGHFDHLGAAGAVVRSTGAPLAVHEADAQIVTDAGKNGGRMFGFEDVAPTPDRLLNDGDEIVAGDLVLRVIHLPGHTPGGIGLLAPGHLFCGDTVFQNSVGRTDLPGGSSTSLRDSIHSRVAPLPDDTVLHPGHGPDTTVGRERRVNPFFPRS